MFKGFYNLTSGMLTQGWRLDVISNNMANVATPGFKSDTYTFSTFDQAMWLRVGNKHKNYEEIGQQSFITAPSRLYTDYTQASFDETGLTLDFGIEGDGYFAIDTPDGRVYTRGGSFSLDDEGYLALPGQGRVLSQEGEPILLITDKIECDTQGVLYTEEGGVLGRIGVFAFADNGELVKNAQGLFTGEGAQAAERFKVYQGMLERSNADMVRQMTEMMTAQRAYQSAVQAAKIYDAVMTKATTEVGRL